jgi:hypothetical protein
MIVAPACGGAAVDPDRYCDNQNADVVPQVVSGQYAARTAQVLHV